MSNELVTTDPVSAYVQDEERAYRVARFVKELGQRVPEDERVRLFMDHFPDDPYVREFEASKDEEALVLLRYHVEAVYSQLSLNDFMDKHGLSKDALMKKLAKYSKSKDDRIGLRATMAALKIHNQPKGKYRLRHATQVVKTDNMQQINVEVKTNGGGPGTKEEVVNRLLEKIAEAHASGVAFPGAPPETAEAPDRRPPEDGGTTPGPEGPGRTGADLY